MTKILLKEEEALKKCISKKKETRRFINKLSNILTFIREDKLFLSYCESGKNADAQCLLNNYLERNNIEYFQNNYKITRTSMIPALLYKYNVQQQQLYKTFIKEYQDEYRRITFFHLDKIYLSGKKEYYFIEFESGYIKFYADDNRNLDIKHIISKEKKHIKNLQNNINKLYLDIWKIKIKDVQNELLYSPDLPYYKTNISDITKNNMIFTSE